MMMMIQERGLMMMMMAVSQKRRCTRRNIITRSTRRIVTNNMTIAVVTVITRPIDGVALHHPTMLQLNNGFYSLGIDNNTFSYIVMHRDHREK
jgi:uncharacterized membrane protein